MTDNYYSINFIISVPAIRKAPTPYTAVISRVTFLGSAPIG